MTMIAPEIINQYKEILNEDKQPKPVSISDLLGKEIETLELRDEDEEIVQAEDYFSVMVDDLNEFEEKS